MAENHHPAPEPPLRRLLPVLLLLLLTVAFYWKLTLTRQYHWFDHPDMAHLELPRLAFQAREIHKGNFPLWDPHIWSGQPLIGQTQPGPLFPLNLLFFLLPLRNGTLKFHLLNWYWVAVHWLAAVFFYWLARDNGIRRAAAVFGACLFAFAGFVGGVAWLDVINGAMWAPLVFLFLLRAGRGEWPLRNAALGGLVLGIAWLSGHHECPILLSLAAAGTWLWLARGDWRKWRYAVVFFGIMGLIAAVQVLPTFEFGRLSQRWVGLEKAVTWKEKVPYLAHTIYSLPPKGLLAFVSAYFGTYADASPLVGVVGLGLAGAGLAWRQTAFSNWAFGLSAISLLYCFGNFAPFHGLFYALLPVIDKARIPARGVMLVDLGLALLAARGLHLVLDRASERLTARLALVLAVGGGVVVAAMTAMSAAGGNTDDRLYTTGFAGLFAAGLLLLWTQQRFTAAWLTAGLLAVGMMEWTWVGPSTYASLFDSKRNRFLNTLTQYDDIAAYLRAQPGPVRLVFDEEVIGANLGDWYGLDMLYGYVAGVTRHVFEHELHTKRTQDLFGVTHFVGKKPDKPEQREVFTSQSGLKVFRAPDALPRLRIVHQAEPVESFDWMRVKVAGTATDPRTTALFIRDAPKLEVCDAPESATFAARGTDHAVIDAEFGCRGLLVWSELTYPGWEVRVDGKQARLWDAYGCFRAVVVDRGRHQVTFAFRPGSVYVGGGLTVAGLLLCVLCVVWPNRPARVIEAPLAKP